MHIDAPPRAHGIPSSRLATKTRTSHPVKPASSRWEDPSERSARPSLAVRGGGFRESYGGWFFSPM